MAGNLLQWLGGGSRGREERETRQAWDEAQRAIAASPLAGKDPDDLAYEFIRDNLIRSDRCPDVPILTALHGAVESVFEDEDIGPFEPRWNAIESDPSIAVEFRKVVARRQRYATDFAHIHGLITGFLCCRSCGCWWISFRRAVSGVRTMTMKRQQRRSKSR